MMGEQTFGHCTFYHACDEVWHWNVVFSTERGVHLPNNSTELKFVKQSVYIKNFIL